ncbi:MAG: NAD(+)/NADH kinase [ANME-2 cluster archaeon]|jgi:NAD+ kinase|nr:NAD(+)/NADH kinase [ANME-2 cluster archaeon]
MIKKVGVVSRCDKPGAVGIAREIIEHLREKLDVFVDPGTAFELGMEGLPVGQMRQEGVDLIIAVGGDGTVLRAIQHMDDPLPVMGVNMGTVGFLVDVDAEEALQTIDSILTGFQVDERFRLDVWINDAKLPSATNEVVIITAHPAKILAYKVWVDGIKLEELRADGLVIATPTGSTAYAMSAGGPIVDPRVDATVVVPLAPFKLSSRPWAIPGNSKIKVELLLRNKEAVVVVDGQSSQSISSNDIIRIEKAANPARFVRIKDNGFYDKVKSKLY